MKDTIAATIYADGKPAFGSFWPDGFGYYVEACKYARTNVEFGQGRYTAVVVWENRYTRSYTYKADK